MKVLQMNCWFGEGSTGKIVSAIHEYLELHHEESYIIYGLGEKSEDPHAFRATPKLVRKMQSLRARITGYPYGGCIWGTMSAIKHIREIKPDVVHIHCINGYMVNIYKILTYLKKNHIPTVLTNHAEFMYTGGCTHSIDCEKWKTGCYSCPRIKTEHPITYFFDQTRNEWEKMKQAYSDFEKLYICNVSDWVTNRAGLSPFYEGYPVKTVFNGLDTSVFHYREVSKEKLLCGDRPSVVHVTPGFSDKIKGGKHVLEMARRFPMVDFYIVGDAGEASMDLKNVHFLGRAQTQEALADYYSAADVCLLTSKRETFSMVTAESLCCGTPVVGFEAGGPESIALKDYSIFVEQGNDTNLETALRKMLLRTASKIEISREACQRYSKEKMCEEYCRVYRDILYK